MDVSKLKKFTMLSANTCSLTGEVIEIGDDVYAESMDHVKSGAGICGRAYRNLLKAEDIGEDSDAKDPEDTDDQEGPKSVLDIIKGVVGGDDPATAGEELAKTSDNAEGDAKSDDASEDEGAE